MVDRHSMAVLLVATVVAPGWGCGDDTVGADAAQDAGRREPDAGAQEGADAAPRASRDGAPYAEPGEGSADVECTIASSLTMSAAISTVASVEFTTNLQGIDAAYVEFGLDTTYGMTAPVDLAEPGYPTLLLGMKASREYHYRVVAMAGENRCRGADQTLETGPLPDQPELIPLEVETPQPDKANGGFIISSSVRTGAVFIVDAEGDYVWWAQAGRETSRARMSYGGKHMWARSGNPGGGASAVFRISMDGMDVESFGPDSEFGDSHHDFAILPDESVLFIANDPGGCDTVNERRPDGTVVEIINGMEAHGGNDCWINSVHYFPEDDTITWSDRFQDCYVKTTRSGEVLWVFGGEASTFTSGDALDWLVQHGHHVLAPDRLLMFENGRTEDGSTAYEVVLDEVAGTANRVWEYHGGPTTPVLGDVQRLPNGNTLVTYSSTGRAIHEVDADATLVRSMTWGEPSVLGYSQHRDSLYGPPPRL